MRLSLDRPPLNVLSTELLSELDSALEEATTDARLKVVVLDAVPGARAFCAGVDVADHTTDRVADMLSTFHRVCQGLCNFPLPIVAVVDGAALGGGCEIVASCDVVLASPRARFGQPEIKLAAFAPVASLLLPAAIGPQRAADWLLTGRTVGAEEAAAAGLVSRLAPDGELAELEADVLNAFCGASGTALRLAKRALRAGNGKDITEQLHNLERLYLDELMATADAHEGLAAFIEKRPPQWQQER